MLNHADERPPVREQGGERAVSNTPLLREIHTLILMKGLIKIYIVKSIPTLINISGLNNTEV